MIRGIRVSLLSLAILSVVHGPALGKINVGELETRFGPLQGSMKMHEKTVLLFSNVKVTVLHQTGESNIEPREPAPAFLNKQTRPDVPDLQALKRKINRLPAYEQVRYWKLHQLRHPDSNVDAELNAALDIMEAVRRESIAADQEIIEETLPARPSYNRSGNPGFNYFPSHRYSVGYRHRRARHRDTQIELDRIRHERRPMENWTTAMSMADRARSDALEKVSGGRSESLTFGR